MYINELLYISHLFPFIENQFSYFTLFIAYSTHNFFSIFLTHILEVFKRSWIGLDVPVLGGLRACPRGAAQPGDAERRPRALGEPEGSTLL